jgi:rubredoxin
LPQQGVLQNHKQLMGFLSWQLNHNQYLENIVRKWQCLVCGFVYEEALGLPDDGIPAGTSWDDIPDDWACPECGVGKEDFEMIEI